MSDLTICSLDIFLNGRRATEADVPEAYLAIQLLACTPPTPDEWAWVQHRVGEVARDVKVLHPHAHVEVVAAIDPWPTLDSGRNPRASS